MTTGAERRKYARLDLALGIGYRVIGKARDTNDDDPIAAMSSDISLGGLRLMTPAPLDNGTMLEIEIELKEGEPPIRAEAEVMWQTKISNISYETGVMIKEMPNSDKSRFMSFVFDQMAKMVTSPMNG
ncbi:MAG: hypothetical protein A3I05_03765 [Deltaproteobacteria bacterium RIFCSPLOWO2_02_FULL_44_10]|nr:MAG: hypothetical protein A3C46_07875 [Deltaproteobacteria bacterium RIFCSPHIGHO2_02_FULL_44_16]OGQ47084.1 MAG: hypothetical protein A3I05_03765 [Deltaproteobacteria bacterium RIFCSPLOWO2_02_FULL_44_10]